MLTPKARRSGHRVSAPAVKGPDDGPAGSGLWVRGKMARMRATSSRGLQGLGT